MAFEGSSSRQQRLKCIFIGDEGVGKSAIVQSFRTDQFSTVYVPTIWNNFSVRKQEPGGDKICLDICDTGGQRDFDRLRPLCFAGVDIFIICFSVVSPSSFQNVITKWVPEIKRHSGSYSGNGRRLTILLVGTKSDLRSNMHVLLKLSEQGLCSISEARAMKLAKKIGAKSYIECSSLVGKNVNQVFEYTVTWGLTTQAEQCVHSQFCTPSGQSSSQRQLPPVMAATTPTTIPVPPEESQRLPMLSHIGMEIRFRMGGTTSGKFFRWKSYNQKRKNQHSVASNKLKRFILLCCGL